MLSPVYLAIPGTTIVAVQHNTPLEDIEDTFNVVGPIFAGYTNASTAVQANDNLTTQSSNLPAAGLVNMALATGVNVLISGAGASITAFGDVQAGAHRFFRFDGINTLTHNAVSLILPGGANITTAANDSGLAESLGGGNWQVIAYQRGAAVPISSAWVVATDGSTATLTYADAGAAVGPTIDLYRNSATPAASDIIGRIRFQGEDSAGNTEDYATVFATIADPTSASEDGSLSIQTVLAGALQTGLRIEGSTMYLGNSASGTVVLRTVDADVVLSVISGLAGGSSLNLYGESHATKAFDIEFLSGITPVYRYDAGDDEHAFDGYVALPDNDGTYTPTLTNTANIASSTAAVTNYMRVGDMVTVSGQFVVDATTITTLTTMGMSLPIASNIGASEDAGGVGGAFVGAGETWAVFGDAANNRVTFQTIIASAASHTVYFSFMYRVI